MPEIAYGTNAPQGLPPIDLPSLDPNQPPPLRIEVTKRTAASPAGPPLEEWTPQAATQGAVKARPSSAPPLEEWTPTEKPQHEVGSGEATLRGLAAGATFEFEPAIVGAYQGAKTALGAGKKGQSAWDAYNEARQAELDANEQAAQQHPYLYRGGEVGGALATSLLPGLGLAKGATTLGRIGMSARAGAVGGGLSGAGQATSEGQSPADVATNTAIGVGTGAVLGGALGSGVEAGAKIAGKARSLVRGARDPEAEARRIVAGTTEGQHQVQGIYDRLADQPAIAAGRQAGTDTRVVDYLGTPGAAALRSAANISPEAREMAGEFVQNRYYQQAPRVANYLRSTYGAFDSEADREAVRAAARKANAPNYRAAEAQAEQRHPNGVWSPKLEQLLGGDAVPRAMQSAIASGRDRAVLEGAGAFNPRITFENGILRSNKGGGVPAYPDLKLWDYTQRELRDAANEASRKGRTEEAARLFGLHRQLLDELDNLVPSFQNARGVAARFFKTGDASEAGERFVTDNKISDAGAARAVAKMSPPERVMFARAFAGKLADLVEKKGYSANVLNDMFVNSERALRRIQIALGPRGAEELEALLRIEGMVDRTRRAVVGNSTSVQQAHDIGIAAGAAGFLEMVHNGLNPVALVAAGLFLGGRQATHHIDQQIAVRVAEMLLSDNPAVLQRGLQTVGRSPKLRDALRRASDVGVRELINFASPAGALSGGATAYHHFFPGGTPHTPELHHQGYPDDQDYHERTGGSVP